MFSPFPFEFIVLLLLTVVVANCGSCLCGWCFGEVLSILRDAGIKINVKKSDFFTSSVQYLGHIFSKEGVRPSPTKV